MEEKIIVRGKTSKFNIVAALLLTMAFAWLFGVGSSFGKSVFDAMWDYPVQILLPTGIFIIVAIVLFVAMRDCEIIVTDKRIYGKAGFGTRVDLPLDMISAASSGFLNSVGVSSASGNIRFWFLKNNTEVHSAITQLLLERQKGKQPDVFLPASNADELKKFKELLDMGAITQEEFDTKKKELLGI